MSKYILEILKRKKSFLAHFLSKSDNFSFGWRKIVRISEWIFGFIHFDKYLRSYLPKNWRGGMTNMKLVCRAVRSCREKKAQNSFFCQTSPSWSRYLPNICSPLFHQTDIWRGFYCHLQLVLKIFVISCLFSDWIATGSIVNLLAYWPAINLHLMWKKVKVHFKYLCLKENEIWRLNLPIDIFLKRKRHSAGPLLHAIMGNFDGVPNLRAIEMILWRNKSSLLAV